MSRVDIYPSQIANVHVVFEQQVRDEETGKPGALTTNTPDHDYTAQQTESAADSQPHDKSVIAQGEAKKVWFYLTMTVIY